tara:strand:+ start:2963 stop:3250 length:288 start_codon:yes stop_codon:yes gene_type:complete
MKVTYKKVDSNKFDVVVNDEEHIGYVYRDLSKWAKWEIYPYFNALLADNDRLNNWYFESIQAGRVLSDAWVRLKSAESLDITDEYNISDMFSGTD